jgi:hypothetical protein
MSGVNTLRKSAHSASPSPRQARRGKLVLTASGSMLPLFANHTDTEASSSTSSGGDSQWHTSMSLQALHELSMSPRVTPLARFSASAPRSPSNSPHASVDYEQAADDDNFAMSPRLSPIPEDAVVDKRSFLRNSQRKLKKLLSPRKGKQAAQERMSSSSSVRTAGAGKKKPLSGSGERSLHNSLFSKSESLQRAQSVPTSPRQAAVVMMQVQRVVDDNVVLLRATSEPSSPRITRGRRNTIAEDVLPQAVVDHFTQSLRSFESSGMSTDDDSTSEALSRETRSEGGAHRLLSVKQQKKRYSAYVKATSGGSTKHGTTATIDFDEQTNEPIVRVRSHSSVDELKRRLALEAGPGNEDVDSLLSALKNRRASSANVVTDKRSHSSSDESTADSSSGGGSGGVRGILRSVNSRRRQRRGSVKFSDTCTEIVYNPCAIASCPWQRFLVPDYVIQDTLRTHLKRADASDALNDPFRLCECEPNCIQHVLPDANAKLFAVYLVDPSVIITKSLQPIFSAIITDYRQKYSFLDKGAWTKYRVKLDDDEHGDITERYRFRGFV